MSFSPGAVTVMAVIWGAVDAVIITAGAEAAAITMVGDEDTDGIGIDPRRFQRPPFGGLWLRYVITLLKLLFCPRWPHRVAMQSQ
jgi:hypothetical protein